MKPSTLPGASILAFALLAGCGGTGTGSGVDVPQNGFVFSVRFAPAPSGAANPFGTFVLFGGRDAVPGAIAQD